MLRRNRRKNFLTEPVLKHLETMDLSVSELVAQTRNGNKQYRRAEGWYPKLDQFEVATFRENDFREFCESIKFNPDLCYTELPKEPRSPSGTKASQVIPSEQAAQPEVVEILPLTSRESPAFEQAMDLMLDRFEYGLLSPEQFAALIQGAGDPWFSSLIVAKKGKTVVATLLIDFDKRTKLGYLSYLARAEGRDGDSLGWVRALAKHVGAMMSPDGSLSDCEMLCLEVENDPRDTPDPEVRKDTLVLLNHYNRLVSGMGSHGEGFRIVDIPGYFAPHQTCRTKPIVGDESSGVLAFIMRSPEDLIPRDRMVSIVRWLWEGLYIHRYGESGLDREIYAAYINSCVKEIIKRLPAAAAKLRTYDHFCAEIPRWIQSK